MTAVFAIFITTMVVTSSVMGLLGVRHWVKAHALKMHHDVADPLLSVVGTMFAVLLGFMVANAMQRFEEARVTVQQEAGALADIWRLSAGLPPDTKERMRSLCSDYCDRVIGEEWPLMAAKHTSRAAWVAYNDLWTECVSYDPKRQGDSNVHQAILQNVDQLGDCRRLRIEALHNGLPPSLWVVLLMGGAATILFTYFFGIDNTKLQVLMTAMVALVICLNVFLLASYDDPFSGDVHVRPIPFKIDQNIFHQSHQPNFSESTD